MDWQFKKNPHAPGHLLANQQLYFITGRTLYGKPYLRLDGAKKAFLSIVQDFLGRKNWDLDHWEIMNNHYHFTAISSLGADLPLIMGQHSSQKRQGDPKQNDLEGIQESMAQLLGSMHKRRKRILQLPEIHVLESGETWLHDGSN